jgi:acetyl-CoA synthetase
MLPPAQDYQDLYRRFRWQIPEYYNIGTDVCDKWAAIDPSKLALIYVDQTRAMGKAVPGHCVEVIDEVGRPCTQGKPGTIAIRRPDPVMFLGYWNDPESTSAKFRGDWLLTGDAGMKEERGWIRFIGRDDDLTTTAGYRVGPGEVEECLTRHPAVKLACVVGKPDPDRTQIIKAYLVLHEGCSASRDLALEIADHIKTRLAAHEYPREVEFVLSLPVMITGKQMRRELRKRAEEETKTPPLLKSETGPGGDGQSQYLI